MFEERNHLVQSFDFGLMLVTLFLQVSYLVSLGERLPDETRNLSGERFNLLCLLEGSEFDRISIISQPLPNRECFFQIQFYLLLLAVNGSKVVLQSQGLERELEVARVYTDPRTSVLRDAISWPWLVTLSNTGRTRRSRSLAISDSFYLHVRIELTY